MFYKDQNIINELPIDIPDADLPNFFENALRDLEQAFDVSISIHDRLGIITNDAGYHLLQKRTTHMHPYCLYKRFEKKDGVNAVLVIVNFMPTTSCVKQGTQPY